MLHVVARGCCIVTKSRSGCFDKHFIVEKGIDQNDFQCRYRLSLLGLELDLDVEINRSNACPDLCNTHTHINGSPFSDLTIVFVIVVIFLLNYKYFRMSCGLIP